MNRIIKREDKPVDGRNRIILPREFTQGKKVAEVTIYENKIVVIMK